VKKMETKVADKPKGKVGRPRKTELKKTEENKIYIFPTKEK